MSKKDLIYEKITALFADDSMPPMILLDGKWGCGKSYYVTNTLIPELKHEFKNSKVLYFSVYGISSLDDFRDKLISAYYLKDDKTSGLLSSLANSALEIGQHFDSEKSGLAVSLLSGFKGVAKHSLLSKLSDFILILDDLERVSGEVLCEQILAECLEFSSLPSQKAKVIAVGNSEKIPKLDSFLNKVFIDRVVFSKSVDQLLDVAFKNLSLDQFTTDNVKRLITDINLKNLRILKRAANKLTYLIGELKATPDVDLPSASSLVARQVIILCHVHYELNESYEAIRDCLANDCDMDLPNADENGHVVEPKQKSKLREKLSSVQNVSDALVQYACGEVLRTSIRDCGLIPLKTNPLDKMFYKFAGGLTEEEFDEGYLELLKLIKRRGDVECRRWFFCIDCLDHLIKKQYVTKPDFIETTPLEYAKSNWPVVSFLNTEPHFSYRGQFTNDAIRTLLDIAIHSVEQKQKDTEFDFLKADMADSWHKVDMLVYEKWACKPLFNLLPEGWLESCLQRWEPFEIYRFTGLLKVRYEPQNAARYYSSEVAYWNILANQLKKLISASEPSLKKGVLTDLLVMVQAVADKLAPTK